ncbi:hypothetical protein BDZ97DRAFT_2055606 [Flammula alnicola]|nr:hypothetical protein BDZ97DRAFT_2055606 [Flammula alnicola]
MHRFATISSLFLAISQTSLASQIFNVTVGGLGGVLQFNPNTVTANPGDLIKFEFLQKNHTATQSSFDAPCLRAPNGFDSDFQPVPDTQTDNFNVAFLNVTSTDPIWVYCRQANHCQQGMVFAVNPGNKFAAFQSAAATSPFGTATASGTGAATGTATATATASATYGTDASATTAAPTTTATGVDHRIIVGGPNILAYSPSNITAAVGDTITFEFHQKNHTVTSSSFDDPCRALASTSTTGQIGFDSSFIPVADGVSSNFPTFTIQVNDTNPIWAYCRQATHCGQGMVFAANAVESGPKNFAAFQALAKQLNGTAANSTTTTSDAQAAFMSSYARTFIAVLGAIVLFA